MTPNAVYETTRAGLSGLVPGRAARRILDDALLAKGRSSEGVSGAEMVTLLLGPVYRDLSGVLPRDGLRREIKQLARTVAALGSAAPERPAAPEGPLATPAVADGEDAADAVEVSDRVDATEAGNAAGTTDAAAAATPVPDVARDLHLPSDPDRVLLALAVLDGVDGIAVFDDAGRTVRIRGDVSDPDALGRVIAASGSLLGRHGAIRTVCITTTRGVLVTVPVPPLWLAVTGASDMNLGAVYAALAALEEER